MLARDLIVSPQLSREQVDRYLKSRGFRDPRRADDYLQQITRTVGIPERVADVADPLLDAIEYSVDPDAALRNLESFIEMAPSPLNLLSLLGSDPNSLEVLICLLAASPYLTQCLLRNPEYLYWLIEGGRLDRVCDTAYFRKQADELTRPFPESEQALGALRRLHRRESLRIGSQDLLGRISFNDTVRQLSDLADTLLQRAFEILASERLPAMEGFAVLALGKLGGRELNFSSDVDLLFIFNHEEDGDRILKFARDYTRALAAFSADGHLYRVDLRLRPMGKSGEIAYSEKACNQYYQTWADTTDRLALIKCRHVAGDTTLGNRFVASIQDFIFKKYLDQAAVEEIRWIKSRSDRALRRRQEIHTHVKLGLGGIREIEFFAQSFQILYGGLHPELRTPNTLLALQRLLDNCFIKSREFEILSEAYVYLRDLEHKLQLVHDLQTHTLPQEREELFRCARRMGYGIKPKETEDVVLKTFFADLRRHNQGVRAIFHGLFEEAEATRGLEELVLNPSMGAAEAVDRLRSFQVRSPEEVLEGIQVLREAPAFPHSPSRIRNLLANLLPHLAEYSGWSYRPRDLFSRFDRFCEALGTRANLYTELIENQDFRDRLFRLLASGDFLAETLIRRPELLEAVVLPQAAGLYLPELQSSMARANEQDPRSVLRTFKRREEFKIALEELKAPGSAPTRRSLTQLAEACIHAVCNDCLQRNPVLESAAFAILALGKLGGEELIFHSDLDLVVVYDDIGTSNTKEAVVGLLRDLREWLQAYTEAGRAYKVDFRLRPEGKHAAEAVPLAKLIRYFQARAEPWERLAYVKARTIYARDCTIPIRQLAFRSPFREPEVEKLRQVRFRKEHEIGKEEKSEYLDLKVGKGSLLDVQFVVQLLQVNNNIMDHNLLTAIGKLGNAGHIDIAESNVLREGLKLLYALESIDDLLVVKPEGKLSKHPHLNEHLAKWLGLGSGEELTERYLETTAAIRKVYDRHFG